MIEGVAIKELRQIPDHRGKIGHMLRIDDEMFDQFGEVYFSHCYPGIVKGWHYHKIQTDNITVVHGMMKIVLYDMRKDSPTHGEVSEYYTGWDKQILIKIPPGVVHGFSAVGITTAIAVNCCTHPYMHENPDEYRIDPYDNDIPYNWAIKNG